MNEYSTQNEMNTKAGRQPQVDLELQRQELILVELEVAAMALVTKVGKLYLEKTEEKSDAPEMVKERYCVLADTIRANNGKLEKITRRLNALVGGIEISGLEVHEEGQTIPYQETN